MFTKQRHASRNDTTNRTQKYSSYCFTKWLNKTAKHIYILKKLKQENKNAKYLLGQINNKRNNQSYIAVIISSISRREEKVCALSLSIKRRWGQNHFSSIEVLWIGQKAVWMCPQGVDYRPMIWSHFILITLLSLVVLLS